ncbi:conjugal transfer protein TraF [Marinomonas sp. M1K-6]|uniref:Conjugal transfer protein TraF n=1 Tax=Marinomonas profundi TaxID=2726122 RepID=A0A847QXD7_9GAMM|nr:conjugal transfer protein TraF [Marinomonas profundi]NLQ18308.1 conjugal transfer protein TraF [Marinomonas profundi]UDV02371.1 conjugal transfer protein TraF [Marinomonas profundi]
MKKYLAVFALGLSSSAMASMNIYQPIGSSTVLGNYGNRHALSTASGNPASSYLMANLQGFRVNFLGPLGIAVEGGGINGLNDRVDDLEAIFDEDFTSGVDLDAIETGAQDAYQAEFDSSGDTVAAEAAANQYVVDAVADVLADIDSTLVSADEVITDISNTTYLKFATTVQAPFLPIIYKTRRRGVFTLDASASLVGRASILADNLTLTGLEDLEGLDDANDIDSVDISDVNLETDTAVYLKRASDLRFSVGYSEMVSRSEYSALILGGRLNFHKLALDQKLTVLTEDEDSSVSYGDFFLSRDEISSGVSLDLGLILAARNYQLGASIANVNEPTFDYKVLGNCAGLSGADLTSCHAAIRFANKGALSLRETYRMEAQMTVDAAIKSKDQHFSLAGSYDVNAIADPLGDEYQWAVVSLSYFSDNWILPGMRVGYRRNLVGNELNYLTAGLTFYRRLDFDVAYAAENDNGNSGAFFSVGYSFAF